MNKSTLHTCLLVLAVLMLGIILFQLQHLIDKQVALGLTDLSTPEESPRVGFTPSFMEA